MKTTEDRLANIEDALGLALFRRREAALGICPEADITNDSYAINSFEVWDRHVELLKYQRDRLKNKENSYR